MKDLPEAGSLNEFKEKINSIITVLVNGSLSENAQTILNLASEIPVVADKNAADALTQDFKLIKKIVANNKDDHRTFTETTEPDESEENKNDSESSFPAWGYAVAGVVVLAIVGAVIVIADRKKKANKNK